MSRYPKADLLLPLTIVVAAVALGASELLKTFELGPSGGDPLTDQLGGSRHGWAMLVLAAFVVVALVLAVATGRRAWAWATAGAGIVALVLFFAIDLPDVNRVGEIPVAGGLGTTSAKAVPQPGFWLEAAAAIAIAVAGIAYATLPAARRQAPRRLWSARRSRAAPNRARARADQRS